MTNVEGPFGQSPRPSVDRFRGKTVIVTGGSSGIGKAAATRFALEGANVAIVARNREEGHTVVDAIRALGRKASFHQADVAREAEVENAMKSILGTYPRVDAAFNNAGTSGGSATFDELGASEFDTVVQTNLYGVYHCMKLQIRHFLEHQIRGAIVNCSSVSGLTGVPYQSAYCASKHAVIGLTKSVALEYAIKGIRVNAICPGGVATPMLKKYLRSLSPEKAAALSASPIGRGASPEEVANLVAWLCSDEASFVIGQAYAVDGGFTAQ